MREPRALLFFAIALAGIAYVAWRGADAGQASEASLFESVLTVGGVFLGLHTLRNLLCRRSRRDGGEE